MKILGPGPLDERADIVDTLSGTKYSSGTEPISPHSGG